MSNYTPLTNFLSKDTLISGNALKAVKGAELSAEFAAIATAVNSKFDGVVNFVPDGSAGAPSFGFSSVSGTGMYNVAGAVNFATAAVQRMGISAAGLVSINGVGTSNTLTLNGQTAFPSFIGFTVNAVNKGFIGFAGASTQLINDSSAGDLCVRAETTAIRFSTSGASGSAVVIANTGGVSINAPTSGTALTVAAVAGANCAIFSATTTAGQSFGPAIAAGTNTSDRSFLVRSAALTTYMTVVGDGGVTVGAPTGGSQGLGTVNATGIFINGVAVVTAPTGTFTGTLTGCSTAPTASFTYAISGKIATIYCTAGLTATSNLGTCTITGVPAALTPTGAPVAMCFGISDNGLLVPGCAFVSGTTIRLSALYTASNTAFQIGGVKGISAGWSLTYPLN